MQNPPPARLASDTTPKITKRTPSNTIDFYTPGRTEKENGSNCGKKPPRTMMYRVVYGVVVWCVLVGLETLGGSQERSPELTRGTVVKTGQCHEG